jgi:hypothetical protein
VLSRSLTDINHFLLIVGVHFFNVFLANLVLTTFYYQGFHGRDCPVSVYRFGISDLATVCVKLVASVAPIARLVFLLVVKISKLHIPGIAP